MPTFDEMWKLDSGFESAFTLTVDSSYFAADENFSGSTVLNLIGHKPDGEPRHQKYAMGADWVSTDGGTTVVHPSGRLHINKSSNYGRFIETALALPDFSNYARRLEIPPTDARIWDGLTMDLEEVEINRAGINRRTGEPMAPSRVMLPVAIRPPDQLPLQTAPVASPGANGPAPSPADLLRQKAAQAAPGASLRDELILLARQSPTFDGFVESAAQIPALLEDDALMADVVNPQPDGLWASARKESV